MTSQRKTTRSARALQQRMQDEVPVKVPVKVSATGPAKVPVDGVQTAAQPLNPPSLQEVEALLQLINNFGRVKLGLNALMLRPKWHDQLFESLRLHGLENLELQAAEHVHWLQPFYRLGRIFSLNGQKSLNMRSIATQFGIPLSSATRIIDQLVQRGLVERLPDAQDRRVVLITLSELGQKVLKILEQTIHQRTTELLGHFSPEDRQQMLSLGQRLYELWTASLEESDEPAAELPKDLLTPPAAPQGEV